MHHKFSGAVTGGLILSSYCDNPFEYFRKEIALHTEKDLLANNDEENRDNFDTDVGILELFGKETLENLQSIIAKVTGLGLVTADFRGEPLTTMTSFTPFCKFTRERGNNGKLCNLSDAFGIVRSAITRKYCIYFCPCGLIEVAIPIIVHGKFLGGFLSGQVRCNDAPDDIPRFSGLIHPEYLEEDQTKINEYFQQLPVYEYEKFSNIAELIYQMINQLAENEMLRQQQYHSHKVQEKKLSSRIEELEYENSTLTKELNYMKAKLNPHFILSLLTDISNLSILENAVKTNQMAVLLAQYLKYSLCTTGDNILLAEELKQIESYFDMLKIKYEDALTYSITIKKNIDMLRIPSHILFPFLDRAASLITVNTGHLDIAICISYENGYIIIDIVSDFNPEHTEDNPASSFKNFPDNTTFHSLIKNIRQRLHSIFGNDYEIK